MSRRADLLVARLRLVLPNGREARVGGAGASGVPDSRDVAPGPLGRSGVTSRDRLAVAAAGRVIAVFCAVAVAIGGVIHWSGRTVAEPSPGGLPLPASPAVDPFGSAPFASPPATQPATYVVHVTGKVRRPGVVLLPAGSRVADAVAAAGGLRRKGDLGDTNLARPVTDGERIDIGGTAAEAGSGSGSGSVPGSRSGSGSGVGAGSGAGAEPGGGAPLKELVDINTADAAALDSLPGIGPVTAARILDWRAANGRFRSIEELAEVPGIGPKTLADLRGHVRV